MSEEREIPTKKIVVLGTTNVGKTSIIYWYAYKRDLECPESTTSVDTVFTKELSNGKEIPVSIWDTAGMEQFMALTRQHLRNTSAAIIVFDLNEMETLDKAQPFVDELRKSEGEMVPIILCGNKVDLDPQYDQTEVNKWCKKNKCEFTKTSAITGEGINELFFSIINLIPNVSEFEEVAPQTISEKSKKGCC